MTLSQILAKDTYYDREIAEEGQWKVFVLIKNGDVINVKIEENIKKEKKSLQV